MLNLSDNELDRLSREAASQHDPGDLTGPQAWERLEVRLDKELGRAGPDISRGLRGFRRLPFQYAPVILLIVGVSYYFVKQARIRKAESSGSPPLTMVKTPQQQGSAVSDSSQKNPLYSKNSTSTPYHQDQSQNIDPSATDGAAAPAGSSGSRTSPGATAPSGTSASSGLSGTTASSGATSGASASSGLSGASASSGATSGASASSGLSGTHAPSGLTSGKNSGTSGSTPSGISGSTASSAPSHNRDRNHFLNTHDRARHNTPGSTHDNSSLAANGFGKTAGSPGSSDRANGSPTANSDKTANGSPTSKFGSSAGAPTSSSGSSAGQSDLSRSYIQHPHSLRNRPSISDSALRKAFLAQTPVNPGKKSGPSLRINRSLTFGLQAAPDFSSVNSLAGDRPGSSIGLTIDYQVLDRWHIGTGLLFSRKNYTARGIDYHVPWDYYQRNGLKGVDFVKGTLNMIEIPLNLRYDFSVTGNTIFFASGGVSTYLFGNEHCNYYYDFFGREVCRDFRYSDNQNLFSSANLSLGVETGVSNSISLLLAPYMKLPLSDVGFGKIRMSSVGINFAVRYSPVISRKRKP